MNPIETIEKRELDLDLTEEDEEYKEALLAQAKYLGIDPVEDEDLLWIAQESLEAELPPGWEIVENEPEEGEEPDENTGIPFYYCQEKDLSTWEHPLDETYREKYLQEKAKKERKKDDEKSVERKQEEERMPPLMTTLDTEYGTIDRSRHFQEEDEEDDEIKDEAGVTTKTIDQSHAALLSKSDISSSPSSYSEMNSVNHEEGSLCSLSSRNKVGNESETYHESNHLENEGSFENESDPHSNLNRIETVDDESLYRPKDQTTAQLQSLKQDNKDLLDQIEILQREIKEKEEKNEELLRDVDVLNEENREVRSRNEEELEQQRSKIVFLESEVKRLSSSPSLPQNTVDNEKRIEKLGIDLREAKDEIRILKECQMKLNEEKNSLNSKLTNLETDYKNTQADNQMHVINIEDLKSEIGDLKQTERKLIEEKMSLLVLKDEAETESRRIKDSNSKREEDKIQEERKLREELDLAKSAIVEFESLVENLKEEAKTYSSNVSFYEVSRETLEGRVNEVTEKNKELELRNENLRGIIQKLEEQNDQLKVDGQEVKSQKEEILKEKDKISQAKEELTLQYAAKEERVQALISNLSEMNTNVAEREIRFKDLERKILALEEENEAIRLEKNLLIDEMANAEDEKKRVQKDSDNRIAEYIRQKNEIDESNRTLQKHLSELQEEIHLLNTKIRGNENIYKEEVRKNKDKVNEMQIILDKKQEVFEKSKEEAESRVNELQDELEVMVEKYNQAIIKNKNLEHKVTKSAKDSKVVLLEEEVNNVKSLNEELKEQLAQAVEKHSDELKSVQEDVKKNIPVIAANTVHQVEREWIGKLEEESNFYKSMILKERESFQAELQTSYKKVNAHKLEIHNLMTKKRIDEEELKRVILKLKNEKQKLLMALQENEDSRINLLRQRDQMFSFQEAAQASVMSILQGHVSLLQSNLHTSPALNMNQNAVYAEGVAARTGHSIMYPQNTNPHLRMSVPFSEDRRVNSELSINTAALVEYSGQEEESSRLFELSQDTSKLEQDKKNIYSESKISNKTKSKYDRNEFCQNDEQYPHGFSQSHNGNENDTILLAEDLIDDYDLTEKRKKMNFSADDYSSAPYSSFMANDYQSKNFSRLKTGYTGYYDGHWKSKYMNK